MKIGSSSTTAMTSANPRNKKILHPTQERVLRPSEIARLQGFPNDYKLKIARLQGFRNDYKLRILHPTKDRVLSRTEIARLQGFPNDYQLFGKWGRALGYTNRLAS